MTTAGDSTNPAGAAEGTGGMITTGAELKEAPTYAGATATGADEASLGTITTRGTITGPPATITTTRGKAAAVTPTPGTRLASAKARATSPPPPLPPTPGSEWSTVACREICSFSSQGGDFGAPGPWDEVNAPTIHDILSSKPQWTGDRLFPAFHVQSGCLGRVVVALLLREKTGLNKDF